MANVMPKTLSELNFESNDFVVTVVIISKTDPNVFQAKDTNEHRSVTLFTIRDNKRCVTNCKCWGSKEKIEDYHRRFNIYDVIDIIYPRVVPIRNNQMEHHFQPIVTLPFQLVLNEGTGFIERHLGEIKDLQLLCKSSIRPLSTVLNLADIYSTNINFRSHYVDLLVVVAVMKPVKDVRAKSGFPLKCLDIVVIDKSLCNGMVLTIWNSGWIERAQQHWKPMKTVLHLIDAKVAYSEFHKTTTLGLSSRSLLFENPLGKEMEKMIEFAANGPFVDTDVFSRGYRDSLPDPSTITTIMTVRQIYDQASGAVKTDSEEFTAVLLATVTKFELDLSTYVIAKKCKACGHRMLREQAICDNDQCQMSFSFDYSGDKFDRFLDINVHFSDHTGSLVEGRLTGPTAEQVLQLTTDEYMRSSDKQKEVLKWQYLLERVEVKMLVRKAIAIRPNLVIRIVDMTKLDLNEFSERVLVY